MWHRGNVGQAILKHAMTWWAVNGVWSQLTEKRVCAPTRRTITSSSIANGPSTKWLASMGAGGKIPGNNSVTGPLARSEPSKCITR